jgi:hypothetical protein
MKEHLQNILRSSKRHKSETKLKQSMQRFIWKNILIKKSDLNNNKWSKDIERKIKNMSDPTSEIQENTQETRELCTRCNKKKRASKCPFEECSECCINSDCQGEVVIPME